MLGESAYASETRTPGGRRSLLMRRGENRSPRVPVAFVKIAGASPKGTCVRLRQFPAEGMGVRGAQGIDVGDSVRVRLASVDVAKDFIDFERK